jgi:two-component system response regulator GlrR
MSTAGLQTVGATALAAETAAEDCTLTTLDDARRAFDRDYLVRLLKITEGNVTRASRLAGRNRTEFYRLLERHSLVPSSFKPSPRDGG